MQVKAHEMRPVETTDFQNPPCTLVAKDKITTEEDYK